MAKFSFSFLQLRPSLFRLDNRSLVSVGCRRMNVESSCFRCSDMILFAITQCESFDVLNLMHHA